MTPVGDGTENPQNSDCCAPATTKMKVVAAKVQIGKL